MSWVRAQPGILAVRNRGQRFAPFIFKPPDGSVDI
jgi:hypothetical protein